MKRKVIGLPAAVVCVLIVILSAAVWFFLENNSKKAENANVYQGGELIASLPLSQDTVFEIEKVGMKIAVESGSAFISESRCKCKTCQSFGKLSKAGQTAVCLPERILIELDGKGGLDAVL